MRKIIGAINMTLDGFCDHTKMFADEEIHDHYSDLLRNAGHIIYGRITYELMETYWPKIVESPTGISSMDEFALVIDNIPKTVFSNTLKKVQWKTAKLAKRDLEEEVLELKHSNSDGNSDILAGSRSLIVSLLNLNLIDEFQICIHPVIAGDGLSLLENIDNTIRLELLKTKTFTNSGAILLYYKPVKNT